MDRFLKPEKLDANPNDPNGKLEWIHWIKTFNNFLSWIEMTTEQTVSESDKLGLLINYVSPKIFHYIESCTDYTSVLVKHCKNYL